VPHRVPKIKSIFHTACEDIGATKKIVIYPGSEPYQLTSDTEVIGLIDFLKMMSAVQ
jgi:hypothetical protein